ncbi:MAG: BON domain-containing protein [Deltaproteobacteria bacterium]|nr:BON domain-containing protein [Deltaproteobacteria bacterium]
MARPVIPPPGEESQVHGYPAHHGGAKPEGSFGAGVGAHPGPWEEPAIGASLPGFVRAHEEPARPGRRSRYRRTDERIVRAIEELLRKTYLDASSVSFEVSAGVVTLRGTVRSQIDRRTAVDLVETATGVRRVIDRLEVKA